MDPYRHANPPPLPDGDRVPHRPVDRRRVLGLPARTPNPPTRRDLIYGWICAGIVLAAVIVGILR